MGSCFSKCWCSCCDCGMLACHSRGSAPISDISSSSTSMLFDTIQNPSPHHQQNGRSRSDSTIACIMKSWKRRSSFASAFQAKSSIQPGFQLRPGSHLHQQQPVSSIEFETLMCDFDIPEPTDRQVLELQSAHTGNAAAAASLGGGGGHSNVLPSGLTASQYKDQRRRVNAASCSPHMISVSYNHACIEDQRIEFAVPASIMTTTTTRLLVQSSPRASAAAAASSNNRSHHPNWNHHHHHPLHHSPLYQRSHDPAIAPSSLDQSFPLLDPLLSYTHETYLGNPADYLTSTSPSAAIMGMNRLHHHEHRSSGNSQSAASMNGNTDAGSLDGFEWDNYDETQIKPEQDDEDWLREGSDPAVTGSGRGDPEDDESFAEVFKHHASK